MPRPRCPRRIRFHPDVYYFKPRGIPMRMLEEVVLMPDELEAVKLYDADGLDQTRAAERMNISQPTFARTIAAAHKKIGEAIVAGKAIRIEEKSGDR